MRMSFKEHACCCRAVVIVLNLYVVSYVPEE